MVRIHGAVKIRLVLYADLHVEFNVLISHRKIRPHYMIYPRHVPYSGFIFCFLNLWLDVNEVLCDEEKWDIDNIYILDNDYHMLLHAFYIASQMSHISHSRMSQVIQNF